MENKINTKEQSSTGKKQLDLLLSVLAEGIIHVMMAEKVKNSRSGFIKEDKQE